MQFPNNTMLLYNNFIQPSKKFHKYNQNVQMSWYNKFGGFERKGFL